MSQSTRGVSAVAVVKRRWVLLELASQRLRTRGCAAVTDKRAERVTHAARETGPFITQPGENRSRKELQCSVSELSSVPGY